MNKIGLFIVMLGVFAASTVYADCDDYPLDPTPEWNNVFRWTGQKWVAKPWYDPTKWHCEWTGPHHEAALPHVTLGTKKCSSQDLLEKRADGCSGGPDFDKKRFKAACNEHDKCYSTPGISKEKCDDNLRKNMNFICTHFFESCYADSDVIYSAVAIGGASSYEHNQKWGVEHCSE